MFENVWEGHEVGEGLLFIDDPAHPLVVLTVYCLSSKSEIFHTVMKLAF